VRIGIAQVMQETSTFSTQPTDLAAFAAHGVYHGPEVLSAPALEDAFLAGFVAGLEDQQAVGVFKAAAMPAGCLRAAAQDTLLAWFAAALRGALPLDGLLLSLHGAFAGELDPDLDGQVLACARQLVGPDVPIGVTLDLHGNLTARMVANADIIDVMHTHPHVDQRATAARVARTLVATVRGQVRPVIAAVKLPVITPAETQISAEPPLAELLALTRAQEREPRVLHSAVCAVQPWLDVPEMGWSTVVTTDGDGERAAACARALAALAWAQRHAYTRRCPTYLEALDAAFATTAQPVVIADLCDLMTGGGTGDSTWYLRELLARRPAAPCYVTMVDPEAAAVLAAAGEGAEVSIALGGKQDSVHSRPVVVTGTVRRVLPVTPGRALPASIGLTVTLQSGNVHVVVFERLGPGADPILYTGAGLDPRQAKIVVVKSVVDFREGYRDIAPLFLLGAAPGLAPTDLLSLPWRRVPRPIVPLDPDMEWDAQQATVWTSRRAQLAGAPRAAGA